MGMLTETRVKRALKRPDGSVAVYVENTQVSSSKIMKAPNYAILNQKNLEAACSNPTRYDIYLDSTGGLIDSVLGLMKALQEGWIGKVPKRILITGNCGSAATLMLGMGVPVFITPTAHLLVHRAKRVQVKRDRKTDFWYHIGERIGTDWTTKLMISTYKGRAKANGKKLTREKVMELLDGEIGGGSHITAQGAVELGLVDGVMTKETFDREG